MKHLKKLIILLLLGTCLVLPAQIYAKADTKPIGNNWMESLSDDILISNINIPGTHDSAAQYIALQKWSRCQDASIKNQLEMGVRYLDIRLTQKDINNEKQLVLAHGPFACREEKSLFSNKMDFSTVLNWCYTFLEENTSETIIMTINIEGGKTEGFEELLFEKYINNDAEKWYLNSEIPTLSESRSKIVFVRRFDSQNEKYLSTLGLNFTGWEDQGQKDIYTANTFSIGNDKNETVHIQDRYKLSKKDKWEHAVLPHIKNSIDITIPDNEIFINFFSTAAGINGPKSNAKYINKCFSKESLQKNQRYGWLVIDFITEEICEKIYSTNF